MIESMLSFAPQEDAAPYRQWESSLRETQQRHASALRYGTNDRTAGPLPVFGRFLDDASALTAQSYAPAPAPAQTGIASPAVTDPGYEFGDVIDMINPLQHLPVVGMLYRKFTGDTIKPISQIIGGAIFGGPIGAVAGTVNAVVQTSTGRNIGENVVSMAYGEEAFRAKPPALTYLHEQKQELDGTTLAVANLSLARDGRENFAAKAPSASSRWNE